MSRTDLIYFRLGGDGLGNLLFTWARCLCACHDHGWRMVWPAWPSFKPKNWRVNPYDKRLYLGLFHPPPNAISGGRKIFEILSRKWFSETEADRAEGHPRPLIVFRGRGNYFADFLPRQALVRDSLISMTRERHLAGLRPGTSAPVALHVRRGDFRTRTTQAETMHRANSALPIQWYVAALRAVREACGQDLPADVYSDGADDELQPLLALPRVARKTFGSSIADLLALSNARLLIASGSTYSMWASYLGQMPTLWHPGKRLQVLNLGHPEHEFEWQASTPLPGWLPEQLRGGGAKERVAESAALY